MYLKTVKNDLGATRFAFSVGKNFSLKAVLRNRTRRILSGAVKKRFDRIKKGTDAVIVVLPASKNKKTEDLDKSVGKLLKKAGLI